MSKKVLVFVLALFSSVFLFAENEKIFSDLPGSYALYHDLRFNNEAIIGICYAGENKIIARNYEPATENELVIIAEFNIQDSEIALGQNLQVLRGSLNSSESASRLLPMIMNWATTWYKSKEKINENERFSVSTDDDYNYLFWIPVFQIETIGKKEDFSVFSVGKIKNLSDERFMEIKELPKSIDAESYKIKEGERLEVVIDGLQAVLDSNWKQKNERVYTIENITPQDAVFTIETLNYMQLGLSSLKQLANILVISNSDVILLTEGSRIEFENGSYFVYMRMFDPVQKKVTLQQSQFIDRGDGYVSMASLACYETIYLENKEYLDKILH